MTGCMLATNSDHRNFEPGISPTCNIGPNVPGGTLFYPVAPPIFTPRDSFGGKVIAASEYDGGAIFLILRAGPGKRY